MRPFQFFLLILIFCSVVATPPTSAQSHSFGVKDGQFQLDGKPFQIISGEMHYARIPRAYWRDRFRMARAMGLNTVTTYIFWNVHEPTPGVYDFSGNYDVAEFIREAQQEGLYVILRPGPYACAEWEFGGYPAWLLRDPSLVVRSNNPKFLQPAARWMHRLGQELAPLQVGVGGPILLVQVENEYGSFGSDHEYMQQIRHLLEDSGFTHSQLYTADGPEQVPAGSLPDLPVGINFGGGDSGAAQKAFAELSKHRSQGPFFNSEFWAGWFDQWGGQHATTNISVETQNLDWILSRGYSVSIYMFHGGTSFGWMNGADSDGKNYQPYVTSYDYVAPLDESGRPTAKYTAFRDVIAKYSKEPLPPVPAVSSPMSIPAFPTSQSVSLWKVLPTPVHSEQLRSMEDLGQAYGYILYRTRIAAPVRGTLVLDGLHDYAVVFLDGRPLGALDRRLDQQQLPFEASAASQLDILVENTGRVNFSSAIQGERKGILNKVTLNGKPLLGWDIFPLPMEHPDRFAFSDAPCEGPCFYKANFQIDSPADTFLDTTAFHKGQVWLNGAALGRVWDIGPQKTLYVPAPWLRSGQNEVVVFDLDGQSGRSLVGRNKPILGAAAH